MVGIFGEPVAQLGAVRPVSAEVARGEHVAEERAVVELRDRAVGRAPILSLLMAVDPPVQIGVAVGDRFRHLVERRAPHAIAGAGLDPRRRVRDQWPALGAGQQQRRHRRERDGDKGSRESRESVQGEGHIVLRIRSLQNPNLPHPPRRGAVSVTNREPSSSARRLRPSATSRREDRARHPAWLRGCAADRRDGASPSRESPPRRARTCPGCGIRAICRAGA